MFANDVYNNFSSIVNRLREEILQDYQKVKGKTYKVIENGIDTGKRTTYIPETSFFSIIEKYRNPKLGLNEVSNILSVLLFLEIEFESNKDYEFLPVFEYYYLNLQSEIKEKQFHLQNELLTHNTKLQTLSLRSNITDNQIDVIEEMIIDSKKKLNLAELLLKRIEEKIKYKKEKSLQQEINNEESKTNNQKLTTKQQLLIFSYLGLFDELERCDKTKQAAQVFRFIGKQKDDLRHYIANIRAYKGHKIYSATNPKFISRTENNYNVVIDFFNGIGREDLAEKVKTDLEKLE